MGRRPGLETQAASLLLVPWKLCVALVCIQLLLMADPTQAGRKLQQQGASKQRRLQAYTDTTSATPRHAPPVQSFLVSDGSWVDCIPIEGQIAAHHPSLKDHVIQLAPSSSRRPRSSSECHPQLFAQEHGGCPEGSIPVLRDDPMSRITTKGRPPIFRGQTTQSVDPAATKTVHEYAITGLPNVSAAYSGAHSIFSVNAPTLDLQTDMSLSQIWIVDGSWTDNTLSTIEVGWQTQPSLHPNDLPFDPHFFIFWTNDAYTSFPGPGACYNIYNCSGFVQTNNQIVLGGALTYTAPNAAAEVEMEIGVFYDQPTMNWWLYFNNVVVGYWPPSIYNGRLAGTAKQVQWGGEVAIQRDTSTPGAPHSKTVMGSGATANASYPAAAYQRNISFADATGAWYAPDTATLNLERIFDNPLCYDIQIQLNSYTNWGSYFFFGGPGGNDPLCHYP